ncbi:MAG: hypothetical protein QG635_919 [Bacteroidota bacterium]|nr:hypothetical protein [Bacteroidota bacterium]
MISIYVGNLSFTTTEDDLKSLFGKYGEVSSVKLIMDRETGKPRGFGFVEMDDTQGQAAIDALDGSDCDGRSLRVNQAKDKVQGSGNPSQRRFNGGSNPARRRY